MPFLKTFHTQHTVLRSPRLSVDLLPLPHPSKLPPLPIPVQAAVLVSGQNERERRWMRECRSVATTYIKTGVRSYTPGMANRNNCTGVSGAGVDCFEGRFERE